MKGSRKTSRRRLSRSDVEPDGLRQVCGRGLRECNASKRVENMLIQFDVARRSRDIEQPDATRRIDREAEAHLEGPSAGADIRL